MRKLCAWLGVIGGVLWACKAWYDWLGLGRVVHAGYFPSDPTDYVDFAFPLLCIGSLYAMSRHFGTRLGKSSMLLSAVGLMLMGAFDYAETYLTGSSVPFGMLFLLGGSLLNLTGLAMLAYRLWEAQIAPGSLLRLVAALFAATLIFCLSPFFTFSLPIAAATSITVALVSLIGLLWAGIGGRMVAPR